MSVDKIDRFIHSSEFPHALLVGTLMLFFIATAIAAGPDFSWDLQNYHFYAGTKFLHGGYDQNLFPSQIQSWFNPVLDGFTVFLMENMPPLLVAATLALLQSLNLPLLAILTKQICAVSFPDMSGTQIHIIRAASLIIGATGSMTLSEIGASNGDLLVFIPILCGLIALNKQHFILSGFTLGLAAGLKLTAAIYAPAFVVYLLCQNRPTIRIFIFFAIGILTSFLLTDGFWLWKLASETGNPFFPAFNHLFHSPWIGDTTTLDDRFQARSFIDALTFPFRIALHQHPGAEIPYYDLRLVAIAILIPFAFFKSTRQKNALILFFIISYATWIALFGIMRYIIGLEILSGLALILLCRIIPARHRIIVIACLTFLLCLTNRTPSWSGNAQWIQAEQGNNWFNVQVPPELQAQDAMFLMLSDAPMAYVIPFFNPHAIFVRLQSNIDPQPGTLLDTRRTETIAAHNGTFWTIAPTLPTETHLQLLATHHLHLRAQPCLAIPTVTAVFAACPLDRTE